MTGSPGRSRTKRLAIVGVAIVVFGCLVALGTWQLQRRVWKLDLIDRVQHRVHAPPAAPPPPSDWPTISAARDEYRHVRVRGVFTRDPDTLVQAVTEWGAGYWVMTPLRAETGVIVLINRGFVPQDHSRPVPRPSGPATVTGLLRISEPKGGFLRANDPAGGRWYSRDARAIAAARGLAGVAPFFIDADATPNPGGWPLGGLTVIAFPNSHLIYAIIWYSLALMVAGGVVILIRKGDA